MGGGLGMAVRGGDSIGVGVDDGDYGASNNNNNNNDNNNDKCLFVCIYIY